MTLRAWLAAAGVLTIGAGGALVVALNASATTNQAAAVTTTTINDHDAGVTYTGTWADCSGNCTRSADGSFRWTSTVDSAVSFSFTGNQIALFGMKEPWDNIATVSIDNATTVDVDYYAATTSATTVQVYSSPTLTQGAHTLKLTMTSRRNPASTGGNSITFDKAVVTSNTTTTPPGTRVSGLAWSSGVWADGDAGQSANFVTTVRGGVKADNYLVYTSRGSAATENNPAEWRSQLPSGFDATKQDLVLALTSWTADGASMTNAQAQQIGTSLCGVDSSPIVRLDWEMNLADGAGDNGAELTAANIGTWTSRFNAVATGIKAKCPNARIDFNPNHGGDQTPGCSGTTCTRQAFQAVKSNVDIYGVDTYDSWPPVKADNSGWNVRLTGANELEDARAYAVANGKKFSVPEWGVWCSSGADCSGNTTIAGGDDPKYVEDMLTYFHSHATNMAYETYFNETATYIVSDLITHNPNSRAKYKSVIQGYVGS